MPNARTKPGLQNRLKRDFTEWEIPLQCVVLAAGVLMSFLLPSPIGISEENIIIWVRLVQAAITALLGILLISYNYRGRGTKRALQKPAIGVLIFSVLLFLVYLYLSYAWTCNYVNSKIIIGSAYTPEAQDYTQNKDIPCEQLIMDYAGAVEDIWVKETINYRRIILVLIYILLVPILSIGIIIVLVRQKRRIPYDLRTQLDEDYLEQKRMARRSSFAELLLLWLALLSSILASSSIATRVFSEGILAVLAAIPAATVLIRNTFKFGLRAQWHSMKMHKLDELRSKLKYKKGDKEEISRRRIQINTSKFPVTSNPFNLNPDPIPPDSIPSSQSASDLDVKTEPVK